MGSPSGQIDFLTSKAARWGWGKRRSARILSISGGSQTRPVGGVYNEKIVGFSMPGADSATINFVIGGGPLPDSRNTLRFVYGAVVDVFVKDPDPEQSSIEFTGFKTFAAISPAIPSPHFEFSFEQQFSVLGPQTIIAPSTSIIHGPVGSVGYFVAPMINFAVTITNYGASALTLNINNIFWFLDATRRR